LKAPKCARREISTAVTLNITSWLQTRDVT